MFTRRRIMELSAHAVLFAPLIVSSLFLFSFNTPRLFWIFVTVLLLCVGVFFCTRDNLFAIRRVDVWLMTFLCIIWLSLLVAPEVSQGMWSGAARNTGTIFFTVAFLWYLLMRLVTWTDEERGRLIVTATIVAAVCAVWALIEFVSAASTSLVNVGRTNGPAGNAMILGNYLVLCVPLALYAIAARVQLHLSRISQWIVYGSLVVIVCGIIATLTRGAYVALAAAVVWYGAGRLISAYLNGSGPHRKRAITVVSIFIALLIGGVVLYSRPEFRSLLPPRLVITTDSFQTLRTRFLNWNIAVRAIAERPLLGWGWENYRTPANKYFDPSINTYSVYETRIDKPHNTFLEVLVTTGIVGFVAFCGFLIALLYLVRRSWRDGHMSSAGAIALSSFFVAYFVQAFFAFETVQSLFVLLFVAWIIGAADVRSERTVSLAGSWRTVFFGVSTVALVCGTVYVGAGLLRTTYHINQGLAAAANRDFEGVDRSFRSAYAGIQGPYPFETWRWFAQVLLYDYASGAQTLTDLTPDQQRRWHEDVDLVAQLLNQYTARNPQSAEWQTFGGKVAYHIAIAKNDPSFLVVAEKLFLRSQEIAPARQEPTLLLVYVYTVQGKYAQALERFEIFSRMSSPDEIDRTLDFLVTTFLRVADKQSSIKAITIAHNSPRQSAELLARIAAAYASVGLYDEARAAVAAAVQLSPDFGVEAEQFLRTLPPLKKK